MKKKLTKLLEKVKERTEHLAGYPCNSDFDYSELLPFLQYPINNLGDPFKSALYQINSHEFEREVISIFCQMTNANPQETWGYVTNGGTEGNMYSMYLARELYPNGIVYYSEETHYSATKILRLLQMRSMMIRSQKNGEIDYEDLYETLKLHRDCPPIFFANIGTTMRGAVDDLNKIKKMIKDLAIRQYYIHADAALSGLILPFVSKPQPFDFAAGIDGMAISGHKMLGSPIPCGVVLAKKEHVSRIARSIEYVGTLDTTLTGSRNGHTPIFLWYRLMKLGRVGFAKKVQECLRVAEYTVKEFKKHGFNVWKNKNSITVVIPRPSEKLVLKWQLAVEGDLAHIITMPHVNKKMIDKLIEEIVNDKARTHEKNYINHR